MQKWIISCITMMLCITIRVHAQDTYADKVQQYISQYRELAIAEQKRSGVPASVTLGQGILETDAGSSELVTGANNHFGIKCKKEWTGETFAHTDDAPNECFRKYKCAADSYKDHSEYLRTSARYADLFKLSPTDYAAWAFGLKRCGYATSPTYAQRLINIIENFRLQEFTYQALGEGKGIATNVNLKPVSSSMPPVPVAVKKDTVSLAQKDSTYTFKKRQAAKKADSLAAAKQLALAARTDTLVVKKVDTVAAIIPAATITDSTVADKIKDESKDTLVVKSPPQQVLTEPAATAPARPEEVTKINGLKALYVHKGELLLQYAVKYNIRYEKLLEINDLPDAPLTQSMYIYLERKNIKGVRPTHTVEEGETLRSIAHDESMQLKKLMAYNRILSGEEPVPGSVLQLQSYAATKPNVTKVATESKPAPITQPIVQQDTTTNKGADLVVVPQPAAATTTKDTAAKNDSIVVLVDGKPGEATDTHPDPVVVIPDLAELENKPVKEPVVAASPTPAPAVITQPQQADINSVPANTQLDAKQQEDKEELDNLKSKLDKLVYADDDATPTTVQQLTPDQKQAKDKATEDAKFYTVQGGDTAYSIARSHNITMHQLLEWNNLNFNQIKVGQRLQVKP